MGSIQKDRTEEGGKERDKKQGKSSINHTLYYVLQQWAKRNSLKYLSIYYGSLFPPQNEK